MKILVKRQFQTKNTTISTIFIDGEFQCFGLENPHHNVKIPDNTRISSGIYRVGIRLTGGKNDHYLKRYPNLHRGMLEIKNVPGFEYILIHIGNYHRNTDGCLLVGESITRDGYENYMVGNSRVAYLSFYEKTIAAAEKNYLQIEIRNEY